MGKPTSRHSIRQYLRGCGLEAGAVTVAQGTIPLVVAHWDRCGTDIADGCDMPEPGMGSGMAAPAPGIRRRRHYCMPLEQRLAFSAVLLVDLFLGVDNSRHAHHTTFTGVSITEIVFFVVLVPLLWGLPQTIINDQGVRRPTSRHRRILWTEIAGIETRQWWTSRTLVYAQLRSGTRVCLGGVPASAVTDLQSLVTAAQSAPGP